MIGQRAHSILIVEDERIVAKDIQQTLAELGYDAFAIASSAGEAIAQASERCPDLVLMDIRIKGHLDGIETAAILKTRFGVPVVFLTAHADEATIERAKHTEPYGYLLKPVTSAALRSVIEVSLYKHTMERRLQERDRWFSTTLRSIADAVLTVDLAGNVTFMNPAAEALTGSKAADAIGKPAQRVLRLLSASNSNSDETPLATALREGRTVDFFEGDLMNVSTGVHRRINDSAAPVIDGDETLGAVMVFRDVTEQKLLHQQLELADRLASLGTMAAGVAHEVNNPLAVVVANTAFVQEEMVWLLSALRQGTLPTEESIRRLEAAIQAESDTQSAASRIGRIVSDLKAFSRTPLRAAGEADVARSIEWAIRSTSTEFRHSARLVTDLADVPPVAMDEIKLGQVLINLLLNATQAIVPGNVAGNQVSVTARSIDQDWVAVEVRDSGAGMTAEVVKRIFEPFFTTKPVGTGTGLGLSICHGIITSVGGQLEAESTVGAGSMFRLTLPVVASQRERIAPPVPVGVSERRGRILVIDDEDMVLRAIRRVLKDHDAVCTESARHALSLLKGGQTFDVIFSDLMMPDMTGMQFYEELLGIDPAAARRVVFLTGGAVSAKVVDFLASVPNLRLEKPFEVAALRNLVQELLATTTPT